MSVSADRIVSGLRTDGVAVDVLHLSRRVRQPQKARVPGGHEWVWPVREDPAEDLAALLPELMRWRGDWQVLVAFGGPLPLFVGPSFAAMLGLPLAVALRGADIDTGMFHTRRAPILCRALQAAAVIAVVSHDKELRARAMGAVAPVLPVPNSIDLQQWQPLPSDRSRSAELRARLVPDGDRLVLAAIGHLKRKKGVGRLVRAVVELELQEEVAMLVAGEAAEGEQDVLDAARQAGLGVFQLPFTDRERLLGILPAVDVVALPSVHDGMPNVMLEAGGLGLPLLASRAGGMGDHLVDGVHGWLFDPGDDTGLRRAVWRMVRERDRVAEYGAAWKAHVQTHFTPAQETRSWRRVLDCAVGAAVPSSGQ